MTVGILMLAAGKAQRFGSDKRLAILPAGGSLLQNSIENARASGFAVRVCVGASDTKLMAQLDAAGVCYIGVVIIATGGNFTSLQVADSAGVVLALLSTLVWAAYWILNIQDGREPMVGLCLNFLVALPVSAIGCYVFSDFDLPLNGVLVAGYVGVAEMAAGFLFWSTALKLSNNASRVSNLVFLSPFISLVFIHFILKEPVTAATLVGLTLIVAGLVCQQWMHERSGDAT